jgi:hypothetical protein
MSMTRANARNYVARVLGGANDDKAWDMAEEALVRAASDWQTAHLWESYLKDTSLGFAVTGLTATQSVATVSAVTAGVLDGVNVGVTVTISSGSATLPAGTTVLSYTRATDGTIATITFSGDIPILEGVQDYNAPPDFATPYMARLTSSPEWDLTYIRPRLWNRMAVNQTTRGIVEAYTMFNAISPATQARGTKRLRVYRIPNADNVMQMAYYRAINETADPVDVPDEYLYKFLDYARGLLVMTKRAMDSPGDYLKLAGSGVQSAVTDDEEDSEDEDKRMISQMEQGNMNRPLWGNGQFNSEYGV